MRNKQSPELTHECFDHNSLCICQTLLIHRTRVKLPVPPAVSSSVQHHLPPSHYCCLQLNNNVTAVTQNSCPQKVYFRGPVRAYHPRLPAQCHIYLSCCSGLLKVSRAAVVACKGEIVNLLPPDYFCSFEGIFCYLGGLK